MKHFFKLGIILIFFINCKNKNIQSNITKTEIVLDTNKFQGQWSYESIKNNDSMANKTFNINLSSISNNKVEGNYCSISRNGAKIDCFEEDEKNIFGIIENDTLRIGFKSSWKNSKGNAKLFFDENSKLNFVLGECTGEIYLPTKILLKKENEK